MKKTVSYLRVSTKMQDVESQRTAIAEYCRKEGVTIDAEYSDVISGKTVSRDGLNAMLEACERGEIQRIVAVRIDRIFRSATEFVILVDRLGKMGVSFVFTSQDIDTADETARGKIMKYIFAVFAEIERDTIAGRVKEGIAVYRAENPGVPWGKLPKRAVAVEERTGIIEVWRAEKPRTGYGELARRLGVSKACAWRWTMKGDKSDSPKNAGESAIVKEV